MKYQKISENLSEALGIPFEPSTHSRPDSENYIVLGPQEGPMNSFYGKHHTEEHKKMMSERMRNQPPRSEEYRKNMSEAQRGEKHWLWGKTRSEETKDKIRQSHLGKKREPFSDEWRRNLSLSRLGKKRGPYKKRTEKE